SASESFDVTTTLSPGSIPIALSASPSSFTLAPGTSTTVIIHAESAQGLNGSAAGVIQLSERISGRAMTVPFWGSFLQPRVNAGGVVNAASFNSGPPRSSPGSLISIFGNQMTLGTASAGATPLPTALAGATVFIGGIEAPLIYASPTQINAQIPGELAGRTSATLQVFVNGLASIPTSVNLGAVAPGIFTTSQNGMGSGAILHSVDHSLVTAQNPAHPGEIVEVYATGLG